MRREQIPIIRPPKKPIRINGPHSGQTFCLPASQPASCPFSRTLDTVTATQPQLTQTRQLYSCGPNTQGNAIDAMFQGRRGRMMREEGTISFDWCFGLKCARKCVNRKECEGVRVRAHKHELVRQRTVPKNGSRPPVWLINCRD